LASPGVAVRSVVPSGHRGSLGSRSSSIRDVVKLVGEILDRVELEPA
jgi:hypothetical protein